MGLDIHALNFLLIYKSKKLKDTVTIGRQSLHLEEDTLRQFIELKSNYKHNLFCEELLTKYFNAKKVDSIDISAFEEATIIHDMNQIIPKKYHQKFDTVINYGSLEHIFNFPVAIMNCSLMLKPGGQIFHILPANNFCGHGFYQFSPELFSSLYNKKNGYAQTDIFIGDLSDYKNIYKVKIKKRHRINIMSKNETNLFVRTIKNKNFSHSNIQQISYLDEWSKSNYKEKYKINLSQYQKIKIKLKNINILYNILKPFYEFLKALKLKNELSYNSNLIKIELKKYIKK
jgi:SAM-dependent methyltransferase